MPDVDREIQVRSDSKLNSGLNSHQFSLRKLLFFCYVMAFICAIVFGLARVLQLAVITSNASSLYPFIAIGVGCFAVGGIGVALSMLVYVTIVIAKSDGPSKRRDLHSAAKLFLVSFGIMFCPLILLFAAFLIVDVWN